MVLEYSIVGGCLKLQKSIFIQEMLSKDSQLRTLLNWKTTKDFSVKHPFVGEPDKDNFVSINFDSDSMVHITESPKELLRGLKTKYKGKIKGRIACRAEYSMFGGIFTFEIDLDSEDEEINYIMN